MRSLQEIGYGLLYRITPRCAAWTLRLRVESEPATCSTLRGEKGCEFLVSGNNVDRQPILREMNQRDMRSGRIGYELGRIVDGPINQPGVFIGVMISFWVLVFGHQLLLKRKMFLRMLDYSVQ